MPKAGSAEDEYEDSSSVGHPAFDGGDFAGEHLCVAVADGATSAVLSGRWARILTKGFSDSLSSDDLFAVITDALGGWDEVVSSYVAERIDRGSAIKWYEEPGIERGAYSTIIGARFFDDDATGRYGWFDAWALGDSCIFQVRDDALLLAFPLDDPADFGSEPPLVHSRAKDLDLLARKIRHFRGTWESGDQVYVATDALAHWFLQQVSLASRPWRTLCDLDTTDAPIGFRAWVVARREAAELHNDDTTLVRIDIH